MGYRMQHDAENPRHFMRHDAENLRHHRSKQTISFMMRTCDIVGQDPQCQLGQDLRCQLNLHHCAPTIS